MVKRSPKAGLTSKLCGGTPSVRPRALPERLKKMYYTKNEQGWHRNTALCIDMKTVLRTDFITKLEKQYQGQLTRDSVDHFTFIETLPPAAYRRNPRLFDGKYVTLTRWNDGTLHLFFKKMKADADFNVDGYALAVCNEIRQALKGLVER